MERRVDGELWLAGVQMDGGGVLGSGGGEKARKRGEWNADILLMLMRARGGDPGLCPRLATAAVKWRPWSSAGAAWRGEGGSSARGGGSRGCGGAT